MIIALLLPLGIVVGINLLIFLVAYVLQTDKLTDITYAGTFIAIAWWLYLQAPMTTWSWVLAVLVTLWGLRLGGYLFIRIMQKGSDSRFDGMRERFWSFFKFWLLQGVSVWVVLLAVIAFYENPTVGHQWLLIAGVIVSVIGLITETVADIQKYRFMRRPDTKGQWIDEGLWSYSRHPNYLGEITVWAGVFIASLSALSGWWIVVAAVSPVYIFLLIRYVSGVPLLEVYADRTWGDNPEYQAYRRRTGLLLPRFRGK